MIKTLKHYTSVATYFSKLAIQRQLEYPAFLVSWILFIPIQYVSGLWMLGIIVDRFKSLNGWTLYEIAFLYGLSLLSHGIMVVLFIPTWHISRMVIRGDLDRLLVRPLNVFFQVVVSYFNFIGLVDLIPATIIFIYGVSHIQFVWSIISVIKLIFIVIGAVLIRASFFTILSSTAFWTRSSNSLVGLGLKMMEQTTLYPLSIYPVAIQAIFTFLIPFGFISFYPASDFLQKGTFHVPFGFALWTPAIGTFMFILSHMMFISGLKKYESAGS